MITHILLDIDGCITNGKNQNIDLNLMLELQQLIKLAPAPTALCTGRSAAYVEAMGNILHIHHWCICENGAYLYHPVSDELWLNPLINEQQIKLLHNIKHTIQTEWQNQCTLEWGKEICLSLNPIGELNIIDLFNLIKEKFACSDIYINHSTTAVDITPKNINKGNMFDVWCEQHRILPSAVLGVGDSAGDMPFLEKCGWVACPANAIESIKNIASFTTTQPTTQGLIDIYRHFFPTPPQ